MSNFCSKCGGKFLKSENFCSECGNKRVDKKDQALLNTTKNSSFKVFVFQIILFPIYPFIYMRSVLAKLKMSNSLVSFCYHLYLIFTISMLSFFYIRFAWLLLDSSPSETDVMWGFSNLMAITPYALWWLTYGIFYILCILMVAGMLNKHLHGKHRINWFVALLFGCFYFQIKLNSANTDPKQSVQVSSSKQRLTYKKVIVWAIIGIVKKANTI